MEKKLVYVLMEAIDRGPQYGVEVKLIEGFTVLDLAKARLVGFASKRKVTWHSDELGLDYVVNAEIIDNYIGASPKVIDELHRVRIEKVEVNDFYG